MSSQPPPDKPPVKNARLAIFEGEYEPGKEPIEVNEKVGSDRTVVAVEEDRPLPIEIAKQVVADSFGLAEIMIDENTAPELKSHIVRIFILATDLDKEIAASKDRIASSKAKDKKFNSDAQQKCYSELERAQGWLHIEELSRKERKALRARARLQRKIAGRDRLPG